MVWQGEGTGRPEAGLFSEGVRHDSQQLLKVVLNTLLNVLLNMRQRGTTQHDAQDGAHHDVQRGPT